MASSPGEPFDRTAGRARGAACAPPRRLSAERRTSTSRRAAAGRALASARARATTRPTPRCCWRPCSDATPREIAERIGEAADASRSATTSSGSRSPGRGSSTCSCPTAGTGTPSRRSSTAGERFGAGGADARRADPDRVRLREPHRPAGRCERPPRGLRRRAGADPRAPRPRRLARVLLQRRRQPDPAAGRVGPGPSARRGRPRGRLPGRVRRRPGRRRSPARPSASRRAGGRGGASCCWRRSRRTLERYGVRYDNFFSERTLHEGSPSAVERALALLEEVGPRLPLATGAAVAPHDELRRRQGPGRGAVKRRAHLPGGRHRLPAGQARARIRPPADARRRPITTPTSAS